MNAKTIASTAFILVCTWSLFGFPLLAAISAAVGFSSTTPSIAIRAITAGLSLYLILTRFKTTHRIYIFFFCVFWFVYTLRLYIDLEIEGRQFYNSAGVFWSWSIGACFLPALAAAVSFSDSALATIRRLGLWLSISTTFLLITFGHNSVVNALGESIDINRLNISSLNPISAGHAAATTIIIAVSSFIFSKTSRLEKVAVVTSCGAGAYLLVLSNSRGPVVSLTLAFTLLLLAKIQHKRLLSAASFFVIGALVAVYLNRSLLFDNTGILYRFEVITSGNDMSTAGRLISTSGAWHQFLENPFFGNSLQEEITKFYPHNVILESLMSTGIAGGIAFVVMVALALHASWAILRTSAKDSWIALISLQYIFGAQFSGAIYQSNTMWLSMSLVCARWWICRKRHASHTEPAKRRSQPFTIS